MPNFIKLEKKDKPEWLLFLTIATGIYLLVEFAFNARLLDVVGAPTTPEQVKQIEQYGRMMSGFAVALMFWGWLIEKSRSRSTGRILWGGALLSVGIVTMVVVPVVAHLEERLVDYLVEQSSPETRRSSLVVVMLQKMLASDRLTMAGFDLATDRFSDPDGKAFLALYSPLVARVPGLDQKFERAKVGVANQFADISHGGEELSTAAFGAALRLLEAAYREHFSEGENGYNAALASIKARQIDAWNDYTNSLKSNRLTPNSRMSARTRQKVVSSVQRRGVPVSNNWLPGDRAGFNTAVAHGVQSEALKAFRQHVGRYLGSPAKSEINPGMSLNAFLASPSVQASLKNRLRLPEGDYLVVSGNGLEDMEGYFKNVAYKKIVALTAKKTLDQLGKPARSFADGGDLEILGKDSVRAMIVPSIALALSVVGALVHMWKFVFFMLQLCTGRSFYRGWQKSVAILGLSFGTLYVFTWMPTTNITSQGLYQYFKEQVQRSEGSTVERLLPRALIFFSDAIIHAQPVLYPMFEWTRVYAVRGFEFGYESPAYQVKSD